MARYIFSKGQVLVADELLREAPKRSHPLSPAILLITNSQNLPIKEQPEKEKEQLHEQQKPV